MKQLYFSAIAVVCLLCASCIKDEPLGEECDIEAAYVHADDPTALFFSPGDTLVSVLYDSPRVIFTVRRSADVTALAPRFRLTPGATIVPASGSVHDFSQPVSYTVTSEDGNWHRTYSVEFQRETRVVGDTLNLDFEHYRLNDQSQFYTWFETDEQGAERPAWATGNSGFRLSMSNARPDDYPTVPLSDGLDGAAVRLTTRSTGAFGRMVGKRIAAGNLFIGEFELSLALSQPLQATRFGQSFQRRPLRMTGYYQYAPGPTYTDAQGNSVEGRTDQGAIYAVFYRNKDADGNALVLFGDNVQTSPQIVALAKMDHVTPVAGWTPFDIEFNYTDTVDMQRLSQRDYSLTVVFSSSAGGDTFEGAVGSQLLIDKVKVICEKEED